MRRAPLLLVAACALLAGAAAAQPAGDRATGRTGGVGGVISGGTPGQVLTSNGASAATFQDATIGGGSGCNPAGASGRVVVANGSGGCTGAADATFATGTLSLGVNTSEAGAVKLFGGSTGNLTLKAAAAAGASTVLTFPGGTTDFSATGGTSQVMQQTSAGGAFTVGQLGFSNLSGVNSVAQLGGAGASHGALVDVGGTPTWKVLPDCTDTGGNHLNYTQSTDAFSCGTSSSGGGGGGTPGGSSGQVQYNNSGSFGGFTFSGDMSVVPSTGVATIGYKLTEVANASFPYQVLAADRIVVPASDYASAGTVTLPASAGKVSGDSVAINDGIYSKVTAVNTLTLAGNGSDTISGVSSMTAAGGSVTCTLDKTPSPPVWACRGSIQPGASAALLIGQGPTVPANFATVSGDTTINNLGVTSTTKVANITYPNLFTSGQVIIANGVNTLTARAPAFTDLTGSVAAAQMPALTGDATSSAGAVATTIAANAVTNAKAAQMAAHSFKGNNTGSTANALDLTATQLTAELNAMVGDSGSGGTKGLVPAPASGDAAAGKFLKADGTFAVPTGSGTGCVPPGNANAVLTDHGSGGTCDAATNLTNDGTTVTDTKALVLSGDLSPTALSGAVNDYAPTGFSAAFRVRQDGGAADRNITGLAGGASGRVVTIVNIGTTNNLVLKDASGSSSAANRFLFGADVTLGPSQSIALHYDTTSSRWRPFNFQGASGACATCVTSAASLTNHGVVIGSGGAQGAATTAVGASNTVLHGNTGADPTFGAVSLTADVSGQLPKANGGTAATTGAGAATNLSLVYKLCQTNTAVTHTGDTTETVLATCTIAANTLGANGSLRVSWAGGITPQNTDTKTWTMRFGPNNSSADTSLCATASSGATTFGVAVNGFILSNRNATGSQIANVISAGVCAPPATITTPGYATASVDTTAQTFLTVTGKLGTTTDTISTEMFAVEFLPAGGN